MPHRNAAVGQPRVLTPLLLAIELRERAIEQKYNALGGERFFGEIERKEYGVAWYFKSGSCICYNTKLHQAFEIHGAIFQKWLTLGGLSFGAPSTDELTTPDGIGRFNHFGDNSASIYWTPQTGACAIWGAIRTKWASLGWERSMLGYPTTDELPTPDGVGRFNHFSNAGSIYWTPETGAHAIYGEIRKKWESLGWERSYLGYPTSDEVDFADGGRANSFQNGGIYWWNDTGAIDLRDVVVHYAGLHCFGETDWDQSSSADEPYAIISVTTPEIASTVRTQVYSGVDAGEARSDVFEIYRGKPYGMNIGVVMMENDFGDPNRYKDEVQTVVMGVHTAGTLALGLIPVVGPVIAAVAGPSLGALMPHIGGALNDAFDWGDDRIGGATDTISAKRQILLASRTGASTFKGIQYKYECPLITGLGASYKAYFNVIPA
jgi:hypothetical protein